MKDNFIHVCFIVDESGSMYDSVNDVKGGFKTTIEEQKAVKDGSCSVSLFKFSDSVSEVYVGKDVNEVEEIDYRPHGMTAMNDGIGTAIDKIGEWLSNMDESERPSKNLIVIMTDGEENNSSEYTYSRIKEMIKHQEEKYNWTFVYMGTDITSNDQADKLGIKIQSYSSRADYADNWKDISVTTNAYRCSNLSFAQASDELEKSLSNISKMKTSKYAAKNNIKGLK